MMLARSLTLLHQNYVNQLHSHLSSFFSLSSLFSAPRHASLFVIDHGRVGIFASARWDVTGNFLGFFTRVRALDVGCFLSTRISGVKLLVRHRVKILI